LIISTCFLYLVAAGLFSRGVWSLENYKYGKLVGGDLAETGSGPGSYDITKSVWHVNCCNPSIGGGGGWGIFNALFGWTNSATYGSVISYNLYWVAVMCGFLFMYWREKKQVQFSEDSDVEGSSSEKDHSEPKVAYHTSTRPVAEGHNSHSSDDEVISHHA